MRQWLIRKSNFSISRPIPHEDFERMIVNGEVTTQDEICEGTGYWFTLQDIQDVKKAFGNIDLRKVFPQSPGEVTSITDTHGAGKTKLLQVEPSPAASVTISAPSLSSQSASSPTPIVQTTKKASPGNEEKPSDPSRTQNLTMVAFLFGFFILILYWLWSGSY